jgi:hypothetical protein
MRAAIVTGSGRAPVYQDFKEPEPSGNERRVAVAAAALSPIVRSRASGSHYKRWSGHGRTTTTADARYSWWVSTHSAQRRDAHTSLPESGGR